MKIQRVEKFLINAWAARKARLANDREIRICEVIDRSREVLQEIDTFFGTIYFTVIDTVYFKYGDKTLRDKEFALPIHERKVYDYRKRYIQYMLPKLKSVL